jgi:ribosomal protein S17
MRIEKKIWPEFFEKIKNSEKRFEIRLADFDIKEGDILVLREWDPNTKEFTGREIEKEVKSIIITNPLRFYSEEDIRKYSLYVIEI